MLLYEHEAKAMLARHGVAIPAGGLWPAPGDVPFPAAVKAQLLEGGRGKRGGVRFAGDAAEARLHAEALLRGSTLLPAAHAVLVEARLDVERELYLALLMDRETGGPLLLAHPSGGVDVEAAAGERTLRLPVHPLAGMPPFAARQAAAVLGLAGATGAALGALLEGLWRAFREEDCVLLELNPLALTRNGELVAADARVVIDDGARQRHPEWRWRGEGTAFEDACAREGATATEMSGDLAIVTSGAGLAMATLDTVAAMGARARCVVDLGGTVFHGRGAMTEVIRLALGLRPRVLLVNSFFQLARCDLLAQAVADAAAEAPGCAVVARMRGNGAGEARRLLDPSAALVTEDMAAACAEAARRGLAGPGGR